MNENRTSEETVVGQLLVEHETEAGRPTRRDVELMLNVAASTAMRLDDRVVFAANLDAYTAARLLACMPDYQRSLRSERVEQYRFEMEAGRFALTSLNLSTHGKTTALDDGQHRLQALAGSKVPGLAVTFLVHLLDDGVESEFDRVDIGAQRSVKDALRRAGYETYLSERQAITTQVIRWASAERFSPYESRAPQPTYVNLAVHALLDGLCGDDSLRSVVQTSRRWSKLRGIRTGSEIHAAVLLAMVADRPAAEDFHGRLLTASIPARAEESMGDPAAALLYAAVTDATRVRLRQVSRGTLAVWYLQAFRNHCVGKPRTSFRAGPKLSTDEMWDPHGLLSTLQSEVRSVLVGVKSR